MGGTPTTGEDVDDGPKAIGRRIARIAKEVGGKKRLARLSGVSDSQLYRYIAGQSQPTIEPLLAMTRVAGVKLEWLATGRGDVRDLADRVAEPSSVYAGGREFVPVTRIEAAGEPAAEGGIGDYAFHRDWLSAHRLDPSALALVAAHGDAMAPMIDDGEAVLVDRRATRVDREGVYVINLDGWLLPKILQHGPGGALHVRSANPRYREFVLTAERAAALGVLGRAVWTGRPL